MLDLDHPQTKHIFTAGNLLDRLLLIEQEMSICGSTRRRELFENALPIFDALGALNQEHFEASEFIRDNIFEYRRVLAELRDLGQGQLENGDGRLCPACGQQIYWSEYQHILPAYFERTKNLGPKSPNLTRELKIRPEEKVKFRRGLCQNCTESTLDVRVNLDSAQGFGTVFI